MSKINKEDVKGLEVKHITYLVNKETGKDDALIAKELVHFKDGTRKARLRIVENYKRPFWITNKGRQNHEEKKDYELLSNLTEYKSTQLDLVKNIARMTGQNPYAPNLRQRVVQRSPYIYGSDVTSTCYLKSEYTKRFPNCITLNLVSGGDIETDVVKGTGEIICMSVSHKENVRLVLLKSWIGHIPNVENEIQRVAKELIPELIEQRNLKIEVIVADTPAQVAIRCIEILHVWQPDWFAFWNIDYDMPKIIATLENEGIDPAEVFSDPTIPGPYRQFDYRRGPTQKVTASGKTMSINVEDRWNWVTHPASFQCIDAMTVYRITRLANGKDSSYALDYILKKELNDSYEAKINTPGDIQAFIDKAHDLTHGKGGFIYYYINGKLVKDFHRDLVKVGDTCQVRLDFGKLKYAPTDHLTGLRWHYVMQKDYPLVYAVYNIVDSIRLEQLDEKTKDLASSITMYSKNSDFKNFNSNPKRLCDDLHFWYLEQDPPKVIGSVSDQMSTELDELVVSHKDWIKYCPLIG